jgi:hypothetical protein
MSSSIESKATQSPALQLGHRPGASAAEAMRMEALMKLERLRRIAIWVKYSAPSSDEEEEEEEDEQKLNPSCSSRSRKRKRERDSSLPGFSWDPALYTCYQWGSHNQCVTRHCVDKDGNVIRVTFRGCWQPKYEEPTTPRMNTGPVPPTPLKAYEVIVRGKDFPIHILKGNTISNEM